MKCTNVAHLLPTLIIDYRCKVNSRSRKEDHLTAKVQKGRITVEKKATRASDFLVAHIEIVALFGTSPCSQNSRCPRPFRRESVPPCTYTSSFLFYRARLFYFKTKRVVQFVLRNRFEPTN